jgi:hypothetical protein
MRILGLDFYAKDREKVALKEETEPKIGDFSPPKKKNGG